MLRLDALRDVAQNRGVAARKIVSRQREVHDDLRTIVTNEFRTAVLKGVGEEGSPLPWVFEKLTERSPK